MRVWLARLHLCFRFLHPRGDGKWNLYVLYIYPLDVEPAAMLHEENKQYTVKRSEPRYNRGILIYSLISFSSAWAAWYALAHFPFNYPIRFLSHSPLSFFRSFYISCAQPLFSLFFSFAQLFSLRHTPPPKPSGCSHQGSGLSCIIIQPSRRAKVEGAKGKTASTNYQKESVSNIT